jgi:hypothetical protein
MNIIHSKNPGVYPFAILISKFRMPKSTVYHTFGCLLARVCKVEELEVIVGCNRFGIDITVPAINDAFSECNLSHVLSTRRLMRSGEETTIVCVSPDLPRADIAVQEFFCSRKDPDPYSRLQERWEHKG